MLKKEASSADAVPYAESPGARTPKPMPQIASGKQVSVRLSGRQRRYIAEKSDRHGVAVAETIRAMLNAQIDLEERVDTALVRAMQEPSG